MVHFHPLRIKDIRKETSDCVSIAFDIPDNLQDMYHFKQGQNVTLRINQDGDELRRSYSICSSPLENELRVAIKKTDFGRFSTFANTSLKVGDVVQVLPPTGRFYTELKKESKKHYLAFAAGSGITPIISIIKTTMALEPESQFTLIYGNRNRSSIIFKEQLEAIKNRYMSRFTVHHILSREQTESPLNFGRIDAQKCDLIHKKLLDLTAADEIFLCGPEEMIFSVRQWLEKNGVSVKKIHFELFTTPGEKLHQPKARKRPELQDKMSKVTLKLDGISFTLDLPFEGDTILNAALKSGAELPFACKGGVCATCKAKLEEGEVEMDTNYALEQEELEEGYILTCQSHPRADAVTVNFDSR